MTERESERVDLRAVDADAMAASRVMGAVMARIEAAPQLPPDSLDDVARRVVRPALIAATVLVAAAACVIAFADAQGANPQPAGAVASWVGEGHVPTNEELLLAFQGYAR